MPGIGARRRATACRSAACTRRDSTDRESSRGSRALRWSSASPASDRAGSRAPRSSAASHAIDLGLRVLLDLRGPVDLEEVEAGAARDHGDRREDRDRSRSFGAHGACMRLYHSRGRNRTWTSHATPTSTARGSRREQRFAVRDPFDDAIDRRGLRLRRRARSIARSPPRRARSRRGGAGPAPERGKLLAQGRGAMLATRRALAELCTRENGKPLKESVAEVTLRGELPALVRRRGRADLRRDDSGEPRRRSASR